MINHNDWEASIRIHPASISEQTYNTYLTGNDGPFQCMKDELDYIYNNYTKKIVVLYYNMNSILTGMDNLYSKVSYQADLNSGNVSKDRLDEYIDSLSLTEYEKEWYFESQVDNKIKTILTSSGADQYAQNWNKNKIKDLDRWELREFISLYQHKSWDDQFNQIIYDKLQSLFEDIIFINIQDLELNFQQIIPKIIAQFNLPFINQDQVETVYNNWIEKQIFANRNNLVEKIVDYTIENKSFDFKDIKLTLYDEAFIQKRFRDRGFEFQCYNLNVFPTNTIKLRKKIIG
jgi:hypothetical protein